MAIETKNKELFDQVKALLEEQKAINMHVTGSMIPMAEKTLFAHLSHWYDLATNSKELIRDEDFSEILENITMISQFNKVLQRVYSSASRYPNPTVMQRELIDIMKDSIPEFKQRCDDAEKASLCLNGRIGAIFSAVQFNWDE